MNPIGGRMAVNLRNTAALVICPDCDTLHTAPMLTQGETALCRRCDRVLTRHYKADVERTVALVLASSIFYVIAVYTPILSFDVGGVRTDVTIWRSARALQHGWISVAAVVVALTTLCAPMLQLAALLWLLSFASFGRRAPRFAATARLLKELRPWSMVEVFLMGALVAIVKLSHWVPLEVGMGLWSLAALTFLFTWLGRFDPQYWWSLGEHEQ